MDTGTVEPIQRGQFLRASPYEVSRQLHSAPATKTLSLSLSELCDSAKELSREGSTSHLMHADGSAGPLVSNAKSSQMAKKGQSKDAQSGIYFSCGETGSFSRSRFVQVKSARAS